MARFNKLLSEAPQDVMLCVKLKGRKQKGTAMRMGNKWAMICPHSLIEPSRIHGWASAENLHSNYTQKQKDEYEKRLRSLLNISESVKKIKNSSVILAQSNNLNLSELIERLETVDSNIETLQNTRKHILSKILYKTKKVSDIIHALG